MKKSIFILVLSVAVSNSLMAKRASQSNNNNAIDKFSINIVKNSCSDSTIKSSPEARAQKHSDYMAKQLSLSATQKKQVYNISLNKLKSMKELKAKHKGDMKAATKSEIDPILNQYDSGLKSILTHDQLEKWQLVLEDHKIKTQEPAKISDYDPTILSTESSE